MARKRTEVEAGAATYVPTSAMWMRAAAASKVELAMEVNLSSVSSGSRRTARRSCSASASRTSPTWYVPVSTVSRSSGSWTS